MRRLTTLEFIGKCISIHGDLYDYSDTNYTTSNDKIDIICKKHGKFSQTAYHHLAGHGCKRCNIESSVSARRLNLIEFIKRGRSKHGDFYDYSKVNFINVKDKITIVCPTHGEFEQSVDSHLRGSKCPDCSIEDNRILQTMSLKDVIKKASNVHNNYYNYSLVEYVNSKEKVKIRCPKHGIFLQNMSNHFTGKGCPKCKCYTVGEKSISYFLIENHIPFEYQKKFNEFRNPKTKRCYIFDFYLKDFNTIIEFDGIQHFKPIDFFGGEESYLRNVKTDKIKNDWCSSNNIQMIRISDIDTIAQKLSSFAQPLMPAPTNSDLSNSLY